MPRLQRAAARSFSTSSKKKGATAPFGEEALLECRVSACARARQTRTVRNLTAGPLLRNPRAVLAREHPGLGARAPGGALGHEADGPGTCTFFTTRMCASAVKHNLRARMHAMDRGGRSRLLVGDWEGDALGDVETAARGNCELKRQAPPLSTACTHANTHLWPAPSGASSSWPASWR